MTALTLLRLAGGGIGHDLSDLGSELAGGLGLGGSLNKGSGHMAAQAQHGSAPDTAGQNRANPVSMILSAEMPLRQLAEPAVADLIRTALAACLAQAETRDRDLGGPLSTNGFGDAVSDRVAA